MTPEAQVIVVGSGPAGVSVATPLVEAGLRVVLVDGGRPASKPPLSEPYLSARFADKAQWKWSLGEDYYKLRHLDTLSPKMRVPAHAQAFEQFLQANSIKCPGQFVAIGSVARGGLSNAWGCGVARLSREELSAFPVDAHAMEVSYATVAKRVGLSGACDDDLADYFGLDAWADPPIEADPLQNHLLTRYSRLKRGAAGSVQLGRSRVAALSRPRNGRSACDLSGNCLWGCAQGALYSAEQDLRALLSYPNFVYRPGFIVERVGWRDGLRCIDGRDHGGPASLTAHKVLLGAGTLATTRLALLADNMRAPVKLQSSPVSAFMLWVPGQLGARRTRGFGLGQLSYTVECAPGVRGFGSLFSTSGIPVSEFARFTPLPLPFGIDILRSLLTSCVAGNLALAGSLVDATVRLDSADSLVVEGRYSEAVPALMRSAESQLRAAFRKLGAWVMPGSFKPGTPGADIHYAATLPMRSHPGTGQTDSLGELTHQRDLHIVDGACLPILTEKSHTLTVMANADRIGRALCDQLGQRRGTVD